MLEREGWSGRSERTELCAVEIVERWRRGGGTRGFLVLVCESVR